MAYSDQRKLLLRQLQQDQKTALSKEKVCWNAIAVSPSWIAWSLLLANFCAVLRLKPQDP